MTPQQETGEAITRNTVALLIRTGYPTYSATIKNTKIKFGEELPPEQAEKQLKPDPSWIGASKTLFSSDEFNAIFAADDLVKGKVDALCVPSPLRERLIPYQNIRQADKLLKEHAATTRPQLIRIFMQRYSEIIIASVEKLGFLFNADDYLLPEAAEKRFKFSWKLVQLGASINIEEVKVAMFEAEGDRCEAIWSDIQTEFQNLLRAQLVELASGMADKLGEMPDGRKKIIQPSSLKGINDFLTSFDSKNITNDVQLTDAVTKIRKLTEGVDPAVLRDNNAVRETVMKGFAEVAEAVDALITDAPRRKTKF